MQRDFDPWWLPHQLVYMLIQAVYNMPHPGMQLSNIAAALNAPSAGEEDFANHEEVRTEAGKHALRLGSSTNRTWFVWNVICSSRIWILTDLPQP